MLSVQYLFAQRMNVSMMDMTVCSSALCMVLSYSFMQACARSRTSGDTSPSGIQPSKFFCAS